MKLSEVTISCSVRVNTGNYEGTEFFISHKLEVDELDGPEEMLAAERALEEAMVQRLGRAYKAQGKKADRKMIAKQHGLDSRTKEVSDDSGQS